MSNLSQDQCGAEQTNDDYQIFFLNEIILILKKNIGSQPVNPVD